MVVVVTEQQLRAVGALPDRCSEPVSRICLMCGTATTTVDEWSRNGNCCGICRNVTYRDECMRCRTLCEGNGSSRPCGALGVYRMTGRVAFSEKVAEAAKQNADAERRRERRKATKPKEKRPQPTPPVSGTEENPFAVAWRRYRASLAKYAVIDGRSNRSDLLSFLVVEFLALLAASLIGVGPLYLLATAVPAWALAVRRLHDTDRSGHWLWLVMFWPIAVVALPVMLLWPGSKGPNRYGLPPT